MSPRLHTSIVLTVAVLLWTVPLAAQQRIKIFIGPPTRDGFVEVDSGVRDSIGDITRQFTGDKKYLIVQTREQASLVIEISRRGIAGTKSDGAVIVPVGPLAIAASVSTDIRVIEGVLKVGDYSRPLLAEKSDDWGDLGKDIAKDVKAWVAANRSKLP
jgi:hypothetical protein